jgi:hypothetical protein
LEVVLAEGSVPMVWLFSKILASVVCRAWVDEEYFRPLWTLRVGLASGTAGRRGLGVQQLCDASSIYQKGQHTRRCQSCPMANRLLL